MSTTGPSAVSIGKSSDGTNHSSDLASLGSSALVWQPTFTLWQPGDREVVVDGWNPDFTPPPLPTAPVQIAQVTQPIPEAAALVASTPARPYFLFRALAPFTDYLLRHWRGELALAKSFWLGSLPIVVALAALSLPHWDEWVDRSRLFLLPFTILTALLLPASIVYLRGVWRAAWRYCNDAQPAEWAGLARAGAGAIFFFALYQCLAVSAPQTVELAAIAAGGLPADTAKLRMVRNRTEIELSGPIAVGLARRVAKLLNEQPQVQSVQLNSAGGSAREARRLRELIASRNLATISSTGCFAECTLAFMAGSERTLGARASLGFHQVSLSALPSWARWFDYERDRRSWLAQGVAAPFIDMALTTPASTPWRPSPHELLQARVVTNVTQPTGGQSEASNELPAGDWAATSHTRFLTVLRAGDPLNYGRIVVGLRRAAANQPEPHFAALVRGHLFDRLAHADDDLLVDYAELLLEQIAALYAAGPELCGQYFGASGNLTPFDAAQYFSDELLGKESEILIELFNRQGKLQPPARSAIQPRWNVIMASLDKRYGDRAAQFFDGAQANVERERACHLLYDFYKAAIRWPARDAGALLRYHFAQLGRRADTEVRPEAMSAAKVSARSPH